MKEDALKFLKNRRNELPTLEKYIQQKITYKDLKPLRVKYGTEILFAMTNYARMIYDRVHQPELEIDGTELLTTNETLISDDGTLFNGLIKKIIFHLKKDSKTEFAFFVVDGMNGSFSNVNDIMSFNVSIASNVYPQIKY